MNRTILASFKSWSLSLLAVFAFMSNLEAQEMLFPDFEGFTVVDPHIVVDVPPANSTTTFDLTLNYIGGAPGGPTQTAFENAEAIWESIITSHQEEPGINGPTINVNISNIDGPGGILGSAGPTNAILTANYLYTSAGSMTFDSSDIGTTLSFAAFTDVVLHEMGHVLGIGTLWSASDATGGGVTFGDAQELYVNNSGQYTGPAGLAAYNSEFSQAGAFVPVELGGGGGTANGHWDEIDGGAGLTGISGPNGDMRNELMTGWLNAPTFISSLTTESMVDLGYNVIPEPNTFIMVFLGMTAFASCRRR